MEVEWEYVVCVGMSMVIYGGNLLLCLKVDDGFLGVFVWY